MSYRQRNGAAMMTQAFKSNQQPERQPYRVRLPGFINEEDFGLGDLIKRMTYTLGIAPCEGCAQRAAMLNRWMVFSSRRTNSVDYGRRNSDGTK